MVSSLKLGGPHFDLEKVKNRYWNVDEHPHDVILLCVSQS